MCALCFVHLQVPASSCTTACKLLAAEITDWNMVAMQLVIWTIYLQVQPSKGGDVKVSSVVLRCEAFPERRTQQPSHCLQERCDICSAQLRAGIQTMLKIKARRSTQHAEPKPTRGLLRTKNLTARSQLVQLEPAPALGARLPVTPSLPS